LKKIDLTKVVFCLALMTALTQVSES